MNQQIAALLFLGVALTSGALVKRDPHHDGDEQEGDEGGHHRGHHNDFAHRLQKGMSDVKQWTQHLDDVASTNGCIQRSVDHFQLLDWADKLVYDESGSLIKAPMSFACFAQCWYEIDDQSDPTTGLPSAEGTLATLPKHMNRNLWVKVLADAIKPCEDLDTLTTNVEVEDDSVEGVTPADINKDDRCVNSLRIDMCANQQFKPSLTDKESYKSVTSTHDLMVAVKNFQNIDAEETAKEKQSKFVAADPSAKPTT
jgi:hypothetical protein